jgi:transcriptional regulator
MADAPRDYLETMVQAVVGIEIEIERLVGKFKLGQNKEAADRLGAANALQERGQTAGRRHAEPAPFTVLA